MLIFLDISNHQGTAGIDLSAVLPHVEAVICKATEGTAFVDSYCDKFVQTCIKSGKPWGFYHFGRNANATEEAEFFHKNCLNYFGKGIPVLDWEADQSVSWVNEFVRAIHKWTGIWAWIYANPWRFNQGGVEPNCMRWVASYPSVSHPTFAQAAKWDAPEADGLVGAWQFCSDGRVSGYSGNLDCNLFYGDERAWRAYAGASGVGDSAGPGSSGDSNHDGVTTLENDEYRVTIERK